MQNRIDVEFALNNYENNLEEAVGVYIDDQGQLCETISGVTEPINGMVGGVILEQGGYGLLIVDYNHQKKS